jgi:hypothetical protein
VLAAFAPFWIEHLMHCTVVISAHVYAYARSYASGVGIGSPGGASLRGV